MSAVATARVCDDCGAPAVVSLDDPELGEAGAFDVCCTACSWTMFVPEETNARTRIAALRQIVREHRAVRIDGYLVDVTTASMLVSVYDALAPASRERFGRPPLHRLVEFGWSVVRPG